MNLINLKLNFFSKLNHLKIIFLKLPQNYRKPGTYNQIIIRQYYVSERPAAPKRQSHLQRKILLKGPQRNILVFILSLQCFNNYFES